MSIESASKIKSLSRGDLVAAAKKLGVSTGPEDKQHADYLNKAVIVTAIEAILAPRREKAAKRAATETPPPPPKEPTVAKYTPQIGQNVILIGPDGKELAARVSILAGKRTHSHQNKRTYAGMKTACCLEVMRPGRSPGSLWAFPSPDGKARQAEPMDIEDENTSGGVKTFFHPSAP